MSRDERERRGFGGKRAKGFWRGEKRRVGVEKQIRDQAHEIRYGYTLFSLLIRPIEVVIISPSVICVVKINIPQKL